MNRRQFLTSSTIAAAGPFLQAAEQPANRKLGITMASYMQRARKTGWRNALDILDHCDDLGAGCLQIGVNKWTDDFAGQVRDRRESLGIVLEGQIRLPWKDSDVDQFERDLRGAKEAGATVLRAVCLGGRRYESFDTLEKWKTFVTNSRAALERAEPVLARHQVRLGVENHKDWRTHEHLDLLQHLDSEHVGVTFDFGNNIALLEDPYEQAKALAPYMVTTHTKDMALAEYENGFLLSEVPLGTGMLDLKRLMKICTDANPDIWFNLEMITRDPLKIPVLSDDYWETFGAIEAKSLSRVLKMAKAGHANELPHIEGKPIEAQLSLEEENNRQSFQHARTELGLG